MARPSVTRDRVRRLLDEGKTAVEIAALLGVNKSTVCYHRRRLGEEIDHQILESVGGCPARRCSSAV